MMLKENSQNECKRCHTTLLLNRCSECGYQFCPSHYEYLTGMCSDCASKRETEAKFREPIKWLDTKSKFGGSLPKVSSDFGISSKPHSISDLIGTVPQTYQPQPSPKEEKPIQLTLGQGVTSSLVMVVLGFVLAVWMISTGKLGVGYDASAIDRTIAQAQAALDSLQTERANLEHTIAELQAVQAQFETQVRTNQQEDLKWAVIGAIIGFFLERAYGIFMPKRVRDAIAAQHKRVLDWAKGRLRATSQPASVTKGNAERLDHLEQELAHLFEDAPNELKVSINLVIYAIQRKRFGEALEELQKAQNVVNNKRDDLANWRAEVAVSWALYYFRGGPEPGSNAMWRKIALAQRLKPEDERLDALIAQIQAGGERH